MSHTQDPGVSWSQAMAQEGIMTSVADEDFTKFLDLENGFEFPQQMHSADGHSALDTPMGRLAFGGQGIMPNADQTMMQNMNATVDTMNNQQLPTEYGDLHSDAQQAQFQQQYQLFQQMQQNQHYRVPPTPVSTEMHAAKYRNHVENAGQLLFDRNQTSFTPLVSPAQTPLDNAWAVPDYVAVDDFFSPLTSPAIEAQLPYGSTNTTSSPIDLNDNGSATTTPATVAKGRRRKVQPTQQRPARSVRQSPAMKPQKRRQASLNALSAERMETLLEQNKDHRLQPAMNRTAILGSSEDSVSPEPLSEVLMRPPPVPSNAARSPPQPLKPKSGDGMPATPAMLMKMPGKQTPHDSQQGANTATSDIMEDIALPDAAAIASTPILRSNSSRILAHDDQDMPSTVAKTPKLSVDSTPRTSAIRTANNSTESLDKLKRLETRPGGRGNKKRPSMSQSAISPALRPKISPSISPLVPSNGGHSFSAETSALYLASKSNYQNILDGTHLPGVSYPETLAENLSSKRTSHKIAEQGRRNRINLALKEIESLLPASITVASKKEKAANGTKQEPDDDDDPDTKPSANGGAQGASKASTVEMAIVYIKSLQAELKMTHDKLEAAEKTIAEGTGSGNSSGSQASEVGS